MPSPDPAALLHVACNAYSIVGGDGKTRACCVSGCPRSWQSEPSKKSVSTPCQQGCPTNPIGPLLECPPGTGLFGSFSEKMMLENIPFSGVLEHRPF